MTNEEKKEGEEEKKEEKKEEPVIEPDFQELNNPTRVLK